MLMPVLPLWAKLQEPSIAAHSHAVRLFVDEQVEATANQAGVKNHHLPEICLASRRQPSCSNSVSTSCDGRWTYLTTEPRMKQFLTESKWGYLSGSLTLTFANLRFRN
eukprot:TRINITY_DN76662_c0_g1_i1.p1 TRINITY_DN76662_c0_g1~~TRINITY_DN76662_c0_g1_i1.p1  ORF type:complete len:108 (+),score=11.14 TRINITY_DN76662_c0_g1_i1:107-430(+)